MIPVNPISMLVALTLAFGAGVYVGFQWGYRAMYKEVEHIVIKAVDRLTKVHDDYVTDHQRLKELLKIFDRGEKP